MMRYVVHGATHAAGTEEVSQSTKCGLLKRRGSLGTVGMHAGDVQAPVALKIL